MLTKIEIRRQVVVEIPSMEFFKNFSGERRFVSCGRTDLAKASNRFS
jgi:hypothetical protein